MKKIIGILLSIVLMITILIVPTSNVFADNTTSLKEDKDIVDIASADGRFTILVKALQAADLVNTLKGKGPYTVFAPTDTAFKNLSQETVDTLLKPENKDMLKQILLYHVTEGNLSSNDVKALNGKQLTQASGGKVDISVKGGDVFINGAKVIITDIKASNGVIHVIDTVLIPNEVSNKL